MWTLATQLFDPKSTNLPHLILSRNIEPHQATAFIFCRKSTKTLVPTYVRYTKILTQKINLVWESTKFIQQKYRKKRTIANIL